MVLKNGLSDVGFEPTPSDEDQNAHTFREGKLPWVWRLRPLGQPDMLCSPAIRDKTIDKKKLIFLRNPYVLTRNPILENI